MKTVFAAVTLVAILATPAFAQQDCAASLAKIDDAMKTVTIDDATKAQLEGLVNDAKAANDNGDAAACEAKAGEALALLGM
jgi:hypothetical protein